VPTLFIWGEADDAVGRIAAEGTAEFCVSRYFWDNQIPVLAAAGYFAVAPNQRGYAAGARPDPTDFDNYRIDKLIGDTQDIVTGVGHGGRRFQKPCSISTSGVDASPLTEQSNTRPGAVSISRVSIMGAIRTFIDRREARTRSRLGGGGQSGFRWAASSAPVVDLRDHWTRLSTIDAPGRAKSVSRMLLFVRIRVSHRVRSGRTRGTAGSAAPGYRACV
jgi:hypothetical protein